MGFQNKKEIRKYVLEKRDAVDLEKKRGFDNKIFTELINSRFYKDASCIFAFVSFGSEVDTHRFIKYAIEDKKIICVPKVRSKEQGMEVYRINGFQDLKAGYYKILEPVEGCHRVSSQDIDFILMPGVAFDREGGRIGYGAGFYDRFLRKMDRNVGKIGIAYNFQLFDKVPTDEFDVRIDGVITNEEIIMHI